MIKLTLGIDGMSCAMCEAHINAAIRAEFKVKKVTSSRSKKETVIISENEPDEQRVREVIAKTGYELTSLAKEPYDKKGLFSRK